MQSLRTSFGEAHGAPFVDEIQRPDFLFNYERYVVQHKRLVQYAAAGGFSLID
jgi:hypothetical protein